MLDQEGRGKERKKEEEGKMVAEKKKRERKMTAVCETNAMRQGKQGKLR